MKISFNGQPTSLEDVCLMGINYYQQKKLNEAIDIFTKVLAADPAHPRALNALAVIECARGNFEKAEILLETLLNAHPDFEKGYNTRGMLLMQLKRVEEAEKDFLKAIALNQGFLEAYGNLGDLYLQRCNYSAAAECFRSIIVLNPCIPQAFCSLGNALVMQGYFAEAATSLEKALELAPDFAPAHLAYGDLMRIMGRFPEAVAAYETALTYKSNDALYYRSLGIANIDVVNMSRAQECLLEAHRLDPTDPLTLRYLGNIYSGMGYLSDAVQAYQHGLQLATPADDKSMFYLGLGSISMSRGHVDEAMTLYRIGLEADPGNSLLHSNLLLSMYYSAEVTSDEILNESLEWGRIHSVESDEREMIIGNLPLKIGFISADFREHSVSHFLEPLLIALDRKRFNIYCYSGVRKPDAITEALKLRADYWVDCFGIPDDALTELINKEKIDILIDLSGHTAGNRLGVFARKPAPLQITWLGYPGTTGLTTVDYRIVDAITDPVGSADRLHTERLLRLPGCFLCYLPPQGAPPVVSAPVLEKRHVTFGSFNNIAKITSEVLVTWGKILREIPDSQLILKGWSFIDDENLIQWQNQLEEQGVDRARVSLLPFESSKQKHLADYGEIDIALDTFPYNGTTTTCEALWMGVPVVTMAGDRHAARVGASLLSCVGLQELVAECLDDYVGKAILLANDVKKLCSYRLAMRNRMLNSPLCDSAGFALRWEDALLKIVSERHA